MTREPAIRNAATAACLILLSGFAGALLPSAYGPAPSARSRTAAGPLALPSPTTRTGPIASAVTPTPLDKAGLPAPARTGAASPAASATPSPSSPIAEGDAVLVADTAGDATEAADSSAASGTSRVPRSVTLLDGVPTEPSIAPFRDGESITLRATYGMMTAGNMTMTVDTGGTYEGQPAIHLKAKAASGGMLAYVITIKDTGESWVDPSGLYSLGFVSDQSEGSRDDYQKWVMDYEHGTATRHRVRRKDGGKTKNSSMERPLTATYVQDPLSMIYYLRAFPLKVGSTLESDVFVDKKVWKLTVKVVGAAKVKTPIGTFDTLKIRPEVSFDGKKSEKGQMTIWVTNDERKIPVKIQSETPLGKVNAEIVKLKEGKAPE